jgi:hypothetical protein
MKGDFFEFDAELDMLISVLLAQIKDKKLKHGKIVGYFLINSVGMMREMIYGVNDGPYEKNAFAEHVEHLKEYFKGAGREKLFQIINGLGWLFLAAYSCRKSDESINILNEARDALPISNIEERAFKQVVCFKKFDLYIIAGEFFKLAAARLQKEEIVDPLIKAAFCTSFFEYFASAIAQDEKER